MSGLQIEGAPPPATTPTADAALVAGLVARDPAAVADLYDRYAERLLGFCTGMLRDSHEAADALHDTILVAADRIGQLRDPERLRPWLYAIARTQCLSRLRKRERTALVEDPTELAGGRAMNADLAPEGDGARAAEGGEASELVWAAAEGLDEGDRVLLELHLRQGLSGGELAAAAGVKPGQISMVTGRMRERLERALGALLVARHGRRQCGELDGLLRDWDGRLTVLMRKRVARHVDRCDVCDDRRAGLVAPLGSLAVGGPVVLAGADLRAAVLTGAERIWGGDPAPDVTDLPWDADGFPPDPPAAPGADPADGPSAGEASPGDTGAGDDGVPLHGDAARVAARRRAALAAAAAVLVLLGGLVAWRTAARDGDDEVRADGAAEEADPDAGTPRSADPTPTTEPGAGNLGENPATAPAKDPGGSTTTIAPSATAPAGEGDTPTTSLPLDGGSGGPAAGPTAPDPGDLITPDPTPAPGPGPTPPAPPAPNPAPTIGSPQLAPDRFQATCNPDNDRATASVVVSDTGGGSLTVRLFHSGPGGGAGIPMTLSGGRYRAVLTGFSTPGTYTWWATASDGTSTATLPARTFEVDPCPG